MVLSDSGERVGFYPVIVPVARSANYYQAVTE